MEKKSTNIPLDELIGWSDEALTSYLKNQWEQHSDGPSIFTEEERTAILNQIITSKKTRFRKITPVFYAIAASLVFIMFIFSTWYKTQKGRELEALNREISVEPGGNHAILTLSNGKIISLGDIPNGLLTKVGCTEIFKAESGKILYKSEGTNKQLQIHQIQTPKGGQHQVTLSDGTIVYLNAASSLRFPSSFPIIGQRIVTLEGEAFFEVAKNVKQPFIVRTPHQTQVKVLGTSFNINAYQNETAILTTLVEGSIQIKGNHTKEFMLKPGEQSSIINDQISISNIDPDEIMAWKNGWFNFNRMELSAIVRQLSRWYNVEFELDKNVGTRKFSGIVSRSNNLSEVLKIMQNTGVNFTWMNDKILVTP